MAWKYSRKRLAELERRLVAIDAEQRALDVGGPHAEAVRFGNAADRDEYDALTREWARVSDEADRCRLALWRREGRRTA